MKELAIRLAALAMVSACATEEIDLASTAQESENACGTGETAGDKIKGYYDASANQSWNTKGVTVWDYRKCTQSNHGGSYLDGAIVANSLGTTAPAFKPDEDVPYPDGGYRVYAPDTAHDAHKLLVYLSGSPDDNSGKEQLLQRAAYHGYHVVAVRYWNDDGGGIGACGSGPADDGSFAAHHGCQTGDTNCNPYTGTTPITYDDCVIRFYRNTFENHVPNFTTAHVGPIGSRCAPGTTDTDLCDGTPVGRALTNGDSAKFRVRKLLRYLDQRHPADGWGQFAPAGGYDQSPFLNWPMVTVMGHSAGSKTLFHLVHDEPNIHRAIFLSGPNLSHTRPFATEPNALDSYVTTPSSIDRQNVYAFSNTHDAKFDKALSIWRFMKDRLGFTGLIGASASGGWESRQSCTSGICRACLENMPLAPPLGSSIRAIQYSGNADWCTNQGSGFFIDPGQAHERTTTNALCSGGNPDSCWYIKIWDYLLTNP